MAMNKEELRETRKQMLPLVTTFSPLDSLSKLGSPLGLPKEFAQMEQRLRESGHVYVVQICTTNNLKTAMTSD